MTLTAKQFHAARRFVDTDFGRIAYVEAGAGPAALFIHGALLNGYQWRHQLAGLADVRRVIALDALGMGHTELRPGQKLGMKSQAAMFKAFLDALGIDRVDLVGNDSGGGAAQIFAARNPGAVRTLALSNCEVDDYDEDSPAALKFRKGLESGLLVKAMLAGAEDPARGKAILAGVYQNASSLPDDAAATYFRPLVGSPARLEQMFAYLRETTKKDLIEVAPELRALAAPAMVLWGTADGFFPIDLAYWLRDNLANVVEVVEIEGGRLFWPEEYPELLNRKLRELWARGS
jgi:pimeloyl-ACP methyl ester carboxylesterase